MSVFFKELSEPNCLSDGRQDMLNLFYYITLTSLRSLKTDAFHPHCTVASSWNLSNSDASTIVLFFI